MHIVILNDDALPHGRGGVAVIVDRLRHGYRSRGHAVTLVTTHQDAGTEPVVRSRDDAGEIISLFAPHPGKKRHSHIVSRTPFSDTLDAVLKELSPHVIHAHNVHDVMTFDALRVARMHAQKVFLTVHDAMIAAYARVGGPRYEALALKGKPWRMRWWDHLLTIGREFRPMRNAKIRRILAASVTNVIVYSHAMETFLHANGIRNTRYIHNGIDIAPPPPHKDINAFRAAHALSGPSIFYAGRISEAKGIGALLAAMEKIVQAVPSVTLLIAGDRHRLDPHVKNCSPAVSRAIRPTGWISPNDMRIGFHATDVATTPSMYLDNFPTINLEAMEAGKPVVGTCFGGTPELVIDGETGYVVNPHDADAYADRLIRILKDPGMAKAMGEAGRKRVGASFSLSSQLDETLALFEGKTATLPA